MKTAAEILTPGRTAADIIADLKKISVVKKNWSELEKEYNPAKHPVMTDPKYKDVVEDDGIEKVTRIAIGLQKLATQRMTQLMFGIPVKRIYKPENDAQNEIAKVIESIYARTRINSINMERSKYLFAGCECATLWFATEEKNEYYGITSEIKMRCKNYSPMNGDTLYALFNEFDDLIALSFEYKRKENDKQIRYFDTYTKDKRKGWKQDGANWEEIIDETNQLGKIPAVYITRPEPIWEDTSNQVYEIEWTLSRNGNYIRKNSKPLFAIYADSAVNTGTDNDTNKPLSVFQFPEKAKAEYITWEGANESIKLQIENLYRSFYTQIQIPDMSFDQMKSTPMSGEARKMMFVDAQLKVTEESGRWIELLDRELNIVKGFVKRIMNGKDKEIDKLKVETLITPFQIADETETIKNIMTATGGKAIISQEEGIQTLGWSDDAKATLKQISDENKTELFNPTI